VSDASSNLTADGDGEPRLSLHETHRLKRLAAMASVLVATILILAKAAAFLATGAVSLLSSLIDSLLDLAASILNLVAVRPAAQPADREHRFGHGKAEALAGLAQAAFVCGSAAFLAFQAGERLFHPKPISNSTVGIAVMVGSIVLTLLLVLYQRFVVRRTGSVAIAADSMHYRADLMVNVSVILAILISANFGWESADPLFALAIAGYIVWSVYGVFKQSMAALMDRELPDEDRERIRRIARAHPEVISIHDLRTRFSGTQSFIQFHLEMDGGLTLAEAHEIADAVMMDVELAFPNAEVLIHEDPYGIPEPRAEFH